MRAPLRRLVVCGMCVLCVFSPTNHLKTRVFFHVKYVHGKEGNGEIEREDEIIKTSYFKINRNKTTRDKKREIERRECEYAWQEINISQCEVVFLKELYKTLFNDISVWFRLKRKRGNLIFGNLTWETNEISWQYAIHWERKETNSLTPPPQKKKTKQRNWVFPIQFFSVICQQNRKWRGR